MFKTKNPMFTNMEKEQTTAYVDASVGTATMSGVVIKALLLLLIAVGSGFLAPFLPMPIVITALIMSGIGSFLLVFFAMRNAKAAAVLSIIYALAQGIFYGSLTFLLESFLPGIGMLAVIGTGAVVLAMVGLHSIGAVRATPRLARIVMGSLIAVMIGSIIVLIMSFVAPAAYAAIAFNYQIGLIVSALLVILGALNLVLDFDRAQQIVAAGAPKNTEWQAAFGILITTIFIYINMLRFLMILLSNDRR